MNKKQEHLAKLADVFFDEITYDPGCEYGSIGTDCKRPFGNSDVEGDILEMLDEKPLGDDGDGPCWSSAQREYAADLFKRELVPYLRVEWKRLRSLSATAGAK